MEALFGSVRSATLRGSHSGHGCSRRSRRRNGINSRCRWRSSPTGSRGELVAHRFGNSAGLAAIHRRRVGSHRPRDAVPHRHGSRPAEHRRVLWTPRSRRVRRSDTGLQVEDWCSTRPAHESGGPHSTEARRLLAATRVTDSRPLARRTHSDRSSSARASAGLVTVDGRNDPEDVVHRSTRAICRS
ncbi:MAG: hypothetical protein RLZ37_1555 [Actinomycetota bacterium]